MSWLCSCLWFDKIFEFRPLPRLGSGEKVSIKFGIKLKGKLKYKLVVVKKFAQVA